MVAVRHPAQRRERLALAAGRDRDHLARRGKSSISRGWMSRPVGGVRDPEVGGDVEVLAHRAADERDLAVELRGGVDDLLDAMHVGGEAGDDDPALAARERLEQRRADARLRGARRRAGRRWSSRRRGRAGPRWPSSASRAKSAGFAVDRRLVELVVAGERGSVPTSVCSATAQASGIECDMWIISIPNGPASLDPAGRQVAQRHVAQLVLLELRADHPDRQPAAVDRRRDADLAEDVGQRADVVLVAVGEHDRVDVVDPLAQVGEVGQHEVDPEHLGGREHQPGVDDRRSARRARRRVMFLPISPEPAERQDPQLLRSRDDRQLERARAPRGRRRAGRRRAAPSAAASRSEQMPSISSAAFSGIGLVGHGRAPRRAAGAAASTSRAASASPASKQVADLGHLRADEVRGDEDAAGAARARGSGGRRCRCRRARSRPSIGPSSASFACLTATTLSISASAGELVGRHVDHRPRGDVVEDDRLLGGARRPPRRAPASRPGSACCSRA